MYKERMVKGRQKGCCGKGDKRNDKIGEFYNKGLLVFGLNMNGGERESDVEKLLRLVDELADTCGFRGRGIVMERIEVLRDLYPVFEDVRINKMRATLGMGKAVGENEMNFIKSVADMICKYSEKYAVKREGEYLVPKIAGEGFSGGGGL